MIAAHGNAFSLAWERVAQAEARAASSAKVLDRIMDAAAKERV
jgi:hypothetical protein